MRFERCVLLVLVLAAVAGAGGLACPGPAAAADSIVFRDAQRGWRTTFVGDERGGSALLWRTTDGGTTWQRLAQKPAGYDTYRGYNGGLLTFADAKRGLWYREGRTDSLWRTTDGGVTWKKTSFRPRDIVWDLAYASARVAYACTGVGSAGDGGSILRSTDGGVTWRTLRSYETRPGEPPAGHFWKISCPTAKACYVLGLYGRLHGLWVTTNGGGSWTKRKLPAGAAAATTLASPASGSVWVGSADGSIFRTTTAGRSWQRQRSARGERLAAGTVSDARHGWFVGDDGLVLRTTNGGSTWARSTVSGAPRLYEVVFVDGMHGWAAAFGGGSGTGLFRTTDGGVTWAAL